MKTARVRYYVDADVLGLAKLLAGLRYDITYPGDKGITLHKHVRPACPVTDPSTLDPIWIPIVAEREWLVITRDAQISQHTAEIDLTLNSGGRLVVLSSPDAGNTFNQLEVVMTQWRAIEGLQELPGPFVYTATRTGLRKIAG